MEILERREKERRERIGIAREFVEDVSKELGPLTAVVIGSTSRGDFNKWSDIDVVLVSEKFEENPLRRFDKLVRHVRPGIEPIPLRPEDLRRLAGKKAPIVREIVNGIVIRDDLGILDEIRV